MARSKLWILRPLRTAVLKPALLCVMLNWKAEVLRGNGTRSDCVVYDSTSINRLMQRWDF